MNDLGRSVMGRQPLELDHTALRPAGITATRLFNKCHIFLACEGVGMVEFVVS